jgi:pimeloyl-ACP methyl ester carboxylesterase
MTASVRHRTLPANGIRLHLAEAGPDDGPVVICCHGFPESWYSWRHQLQALGDAGYHVIAPDMRGYGRSAKPADPHAYSQLHHVGDLVGVLDAIAVPEAVVVGHDWGGPVAWHAALLRPDRFRAVAVLGVPFMPRGGIAPTAAMKAIFGDQWFYFLYFQQPGKAEAELDANVETFLRGFLYSLSGDAPREVLAALAGGSKKTGILEHLAQPDELPSWLTADDLAHYVGEFERTGFRGGLSWYRSADTTWELTSSFADWRIRQPALFVSGEREPVLAMSPGALEAMPETVPGLRDVVMLSGCGHWTQQERPAEVNEALLAFLGAL